MSQSDAHKQLVIRVVGALQSRYPRISIVTDIQQNPGDAVPPIIDGYRPDVYANITSANHTLIAEAKTDCDLNNTHTYNQILTFISYLERRRNGIFVLSVTGCRADRAKTILRFMHQEERVMSTDIAIFDGCDFWCFDQTGSITWRLS